MEKIKCIIQYDGSNFSGFQVQPRKRTIQGEIERALATLHKGEKIRLHPAGRTDKGVHAVGQVFHFETSYRIKESGWKKALNDLLPKDLYIKEVTYVPPLFHSRYDAVEKEYKYIVDRSQTPNVFTHNYTHHFTKPLDIEKIKAACIYFQGKHDFTTFSSARDTAKGSKVRTLTDVSCEENGEELIFTFKGDGYLYNMVRIIVGTLLDIGQEKREAGDIETLFAARDRRFASPTAPAQGLYLWRVTYPENRS